MKIYDIFVIFPLFAFHSPILVLAIFNGSLNSEQRVAAVPAEAKARAKTRAKLDFTLSSQQLCIGRPS